MVELEVGKRVMECRPVRCGRCGQDGVAGQSAGQLVFDAVYYFQLSQMEVLRCHGRALFKALATAKPLSTLYAVH